MVGCSIPISIGVFTNSAANEPDTSAAFRNSEVRESSYIDAYTKLGQLKDSCRFTSWLKRIGEQQHQHAPKGKSPLIQDGRGGKACSGQHT
jgi:hypothetical protein